MHRNKSGLLVDDIWDETMTAGGKARTDIRSILTQMGYDSYFCYKRYFHKNVLNYIPALCRLPLLLLKAQAYRFLVIQYPFYTNPRFNWIFFHLFPKRAILVIHDLNSLRYGLGEHTIRKEMKLLNRFQKAVIHTESMRNWLLQQNARFHMEILEMFDYLLPETPAPPVWDPSQKPVVIFAGNLGKSPFLQKLAKMDGCGMHLVCYGPGASEELERTGCCRGALPSDQLPFCMNGQYGLVWDGSSTESCVGAEGGYLRYNSPHKFSLYLAAGIPVIVWNQSAMADLVQREGIGLTISSLKDLPKVLSTVSADQYQKMTAACRKLQPELIRGNFFKRTLKALLQ